MDHGGKQVRPSGVACPCEGFGLARPQDLIDSPEMLRLFFLVITAAAVLSANASDVLAQVEAWRKAVLAHDTKTLDRLMGDRVLYSHSNGKLENKAEFMKAWGPSGTANYEKVELGQQTVEMYGNIAVVRGDITIDNAPKAGAKQHLKLNVMQIWEKGKAGWQMVARQATRLP
jgi:ketosteroid isomerase-like protein